MIAAALDSNVLGLAFLRGMVASINPCGFVLLPTYLLFFLGVQAAEQAGDQRASVRRALVVGSAVSAGFVAVFLVVGIVTETIDSWLLSNAKYATVVIGVAFVILGVAMLAGYRPRFATPHLDAGGRTRSVGSMFVYGIAYAVASLGCTMPLFLVTVFGTGRREGFAAGVANAVFYGAGMGLVVIALTVSLAGANQLLLGALRSAMRYVDLIAAAFLVLSGVYLLYYFAVVDVGEDTTSITDSVLRFQSRVSTTLAERWELIAIVLAGGCRRGPRVRDPAAAGECGAKWRDGTRVTDVPIHPAATVMLLRDAEGSRVEVLMVRRTAAAAFAGGLYVFPGGRVDDADGAPELAAFIDGIDDKAASTTLGIASGGLAYWVAAIRECFEEAGLLLARCNGEGASAGDVGGRACGGARWRVVDGRAVPTTRRGARRRGAAVRLALGDAGRRVAASLRHPLLSGGRPRRPGRPSR